MTPLDYLLILEGLVLLTAGVFWAIGESFGKSNADDELRRVMRAFFRELMHPTPWQPVTGFSEGESSGDELAVQEPSRSAGKKGKAGKGNAGKPVATLNVKVVSGPSPNQIAGRLGDAVKVQVTAAPEAGEANKAVIDLLSEALELPGYNIKLVRGHYDSRKTLQITGLSTAEVDEKLARFL